LGEKWIGEGRKVTLVGAPDADILPGKQSKSSKNEQQQEQRRFWSKLKRIEENLQMKKPTSKQTRLF